MSGRVTTLILINVLIVSLNSIFARLAMSFLEPLPYLILSQALAGLILLPPAIASGRLALLREPRRLLAVAGIALLAQTIAMLLFFKASKVLPASRVVVLCQVEVLYGLVMGALVLGESLGPRQLAATGLVTAGMVIALAAGPFQGFGTADLMVLAVPLCFQLGHVIAKSVLPVLGSDVITAGRAGFAFLFLLPLAPTVPAAAWRACLTPQALGLIAFNALVLTALSLRLWYAALSRGGLSQVTTLTLTYPLVTLFIAQHLPWLREPVTIRHYLGAGLVIVGAFLLTRLPVSPLPALAARQEA